MAIRWPVVGICLGLLGCPKPPPVGPPPEPERFVEIDLSAEYELLASGLLSELSRAEQVTECGDLAKFEPAARLASLDSGSIACLLQLLDDTERLTGKNEISRVLMVDAWEKGDRHRWELLARRHMTEIDQSDADMAYQLTYHLVSLGNPDDMDEAMYWAEVGLERRSHWEGQTHVDRTYHLHKFRTYAGLKKWSYLESEVKRQATRVSKEQAEITRLAVRVAAGEWQAYARASGLDIAEPRRICEMATGSPGPCAEDLGEMPPNPISVDRER